MCQQLKPVCASNSITRTLVAANRTSIAAYGKEHAILIDHTENWKHHGLLDEDRAWSLEPVSLKTMRFNQQCLNALISSSLCPHELKPRYIIDAATREFKPIYQSICPPKLDGV